ncbi:MAG: hypothetical protein KDK30_00945 [Leptospiraceae bacterium]|nr:hypothetical protein [Leptospiraceae bacterium]MCB1317165.1 hypothetical protein [Leptospiraceae bacterium]
MDLHNSLRELNRLLEKHRGIPDAESHAKKTKSLQKAVQDYLEILWAEERSASPLYNELKQALNKAERNRRINEHWYKERLKRYGARKKQNEKYASRLADVIFDAGDAKTVIQELEKSPEALKREEFQRLVARPYAEVESRIGELKGQNLWDMCQAASVQPVRTKSGSPSPAKSRAVLLDRVREIQERI